MEARVRARLEATVSALCVHVRIVVEVGTSGTKTETWVAESNTKNEASKLGCEAGLETEAGSREPVDKAGIFETKTWAAETKTIEIGCRGAASVSRQV